MTVKGLLAVAVLLLAGLHLGPTAAEPVGPGAGSSSTPSSCDRCNACRHVIKPADTGNPTKDSTPNLSRTARCNADCTDCLLQSDVPNSTPENPVNQTNEEHAR
jgi:hypothetical protein